MIELLPSIGINDVFEYVSLAVACYYIMRKLYEWEPVGYP